MNELLKRLGIGALIGLAVALIIYFGSNKISFIKTILDGYEYQSYDSRMRVRVEDVKEQTIDSVIIIDIDQNSVAATNGSWISMLAYEEGLGNYKDWPHAIHGKLIETVSMGNPKGILFDIIFDPEKIDNYLLFQDLVREHEFKTPEMVNRVNDFLFGNNPYAFIDQTAASQKVYFK